MERLFAKISKKKTEYYVISRIWHQLNDDRVKFVVQQYIRRTQDKYALADLYLPQLNLFIEINEPFHKNNVEVDRIRNEEIISKTKYNLLVIDCGYKDAENKIYWNSLDEIHQQISIIVLDIKSRIKELGEKFIPWDDSETFSVEYHKNKGVLKVDNYECLRTIEEIAEAFGVKVKHRGFLRASGVALPNKPNEVVWWPNKEHQLWCNNISDDGLFIYEFPKAKEKILAHLNEWINKTEHTRITFLKYKDELGFSFYRFVGVFKLNKDKSIKENKCVWERISDTYKINV